MAIGHVDFYPNGGFNNPGCDVTVQDYMQRGSLFWGIQQFLSCNHIRSQQFLIESLKTRCPFLGISCDSYDDFRQGHCFRCNEDNHNCIPFGMNSMNIYQHLLSSGKIMNPSAPTRVYLMTSGASPFCRAHFKVTIVMSASDESSMHGGEIGIMSMVVHQNKTTTENMKISKEPE